MPPTYLRMIFDSDKERYKEWLEDIDRRIENLKKLKIRIEARFDRKMREWEKSNI